MEQTALASCAFAGFGLLARRPAMLLAWWLVVVTLCGAFIGGSLFLTSRSGPAYFFVHLLGPVGTPFLWLIATVLIGAVFRQTLRPERRLIGLRLGVDELRLAPLTLLLGAILVVGMTPALLSGREELAATAVLLLVSPLACLILPAVFAARRLDVLGGWRLARGRYLDLLLMNLLTWGIYATLSVLFGKLWGWLIVLNDDRISRAIHLGSAAFAGVLSAAMVLAVPIYGALLVIVAAPSAEAYRRLTSPPAPGP